MAVSHSGLEGWFHGKKNIKWSPWMEMIGQQWLVSLMPSGELIWQWKITIFYWKPWGKPAFFYRENVGNQLFLWWVCQVSSRPAPAPPHDGVVDAGGSEVFFSFQLPKPTAVKLGYQLKLEYWRLSCKDWNLSALESGNPKGVGKRNTSSLENVVLWWLGERKQGQEI